MTKPPRVRFAPSPTGPLHIGGVRTALYNYLLARKLGGTFILRIEDTDQKRFVPGAEAYILEALQWCGMTIDEGPGIGGPHEPYRQSERKPMYRQYAEQLIEAGHAYYAFDTAEELEEMRVKMEKAGMKSPGYNYLTREHMQNSLTLPAEEVQRRLERGDDYVVRIKMPRKEDIRFEDIVRGWVVVSTSQLDDKVLLKSDGMPTYHLANVVDDHLMEITHVIRGEEWLPSTPLHVLMYRSFGWEMPQFAHLPLLLKPTGTGKLSKRDGDQLGFPVFPLEWTDPETGEVSSGYRESGYLPVALVNYLALLGWHPAGDQELFTMPELIEAFELERVGKSGVKFNKEKLQFFNGHYIRETPNAEFLPLLKEYLTAAMVPHPSDKALLSLIDLLKERVQLLPDFYRESHYFFFAPQLTAEDYASKAWKADFVPVFTAIAEALRLLDNWTADSIKATVQEVAQSHGVKFGQLMPMLRLAATGTNAGPGVFEILEWLGQMEVNDRFAAALAGQA